MPEPMTVTMARKAAVAFLEAHTPARYDTPEADAVGQRRQRDQHYSACADLAHAMYEALGLHHTRINRAPHWKCGANVGLLAYWGGVAGCALGKFVPYPIDWSAVDGGDVLIRWYPGQPETDHVACVMSPVVDGRLNTAEYGQSRPLIGRQFVRAVQGQGTPWQRWLPLPAVMRACGVVV